MPFRKKAIVVMSHIYRFKKDVHPKNEQFEKIVKLKEAANNFVMFRKYRLGIAKLKNFFRSFLTHSKNLWHNFKNVLFSWIFYWLTDWLTNWLTDWLTPLLMPSDKHNSITAIATALISSLFNVTLSRNVPFRQPQQLQCLHHGSTKAYLCFPFLSPLPHRW